MRALKIATELPWASWSHVRNDVSCGREARRAWPRVGLFKHSLKTFKEEDDTYAQDVYSGPVAACHFKCPQVEHACIILRQSPLHHVNMKFSIKLILLKLSRLGCQNESRHHRHMSPCLYMLQRCNSARRKNSGWIAALLPTKYKGEQARARRI